jgi:hypothetical protein
MIGSPRGINVSRLQRDLNALGIVEKNTEFILFSACPKMAIFPNFCVRLARHGGINPRNTQCINACPDDNRCG